MNTYVKIIIVGAGMFVTVSVMMFAMPFILMVFFSESRSSGRVGNARIRRLHN